MGYTETHQIEIPPITLPAGVSVVVTVVAGTGGQQAVQITGVTSTSKEDTIALLHEAFALLQTAASAEGVGMPVFITDSKPPSVPTGLTATAASSTEVDLAWVAASDNIAVHHYEVSRNGSVVAEVAAQYTSYRDTAAVAATAYTYTVVSVDEAGNRSAAASVSVTTP